MKTWLEPVEKALDQCPEPLICYFRDDDGGWADQQLFKLLDLFAQHEAPIDLAMIPTVVSESLAITLRVRIENNAQPISLHQHGYSHTNHETSGRKCEFGHARSFEQQKTDIWLGQLKLQTLFGDSLQPLFTPPWNRCIQATVQALHQLGFKVLSRDSSAIPLDTEGMMEISVHIDWLRKLKGNRISYTQLAEQIASQIQQQAQLGIMLHHQPMDEDDHRMLGELLTLLARHPLARFSAM